jgi:anhydro-N-acetylmuramic acid kinase
MKKNQYHILGVMSGTSLDGIDLSECFFSISESGNWSFKIGKTTTIAYTENWKQRLKEAIHFSEGRLQTLNEEYTRLLGGIISQFISEEKIENLDAVCSHGHTILHQPEKGITLQIGNLPEIAELTNQKVVCDFRVKDVSLGGQGAPLVPIGDQLLFPEYDYCLNLGGFANCSYEQDNKRIAYDICPVNIVLNVLANDLGLPYDDAGKVAEAGNLDKTLLEKLKVLDFYKLSPPKSLGLEWVQKEIFPILNASNISTEDKLCTFTSHVAMELARQFKTGSTFLVTGGGAYNTYLMERIQFYKELDLVVPNKTLLEFKEALVFGLLGVLRLRNEVNCLSSVTGASKDNCGGKVYGS